MRFGVCWLRWSEDPSNVLVLYSDGRCVTDMLIVKDCFCLIDCFYGLYGIELTIYFCLLTLPLKNGPQTCRYTVCPHACFVCPHATKCTWTLKNENYFWSAIPHLKFYLEVFQNHRFGSPMFLHCVTTRFNGAKNTVVQILGWRNYTSNSLLLAKVPKCNEWNVNISNDKNLIVEGIWGILLPSDVRDWGLE